MSSKIIKHIINHIIIEERYARFGQKLFEIYGIINNSKHYLSVELI